ncbi:unnamed protein product [Prorocentrum cordatum]|uniref:Uncharacterized protein n=1 Tax=Prorocentrum cordatum TaxID=2364126 RepID=A0ABN9SKN9_9DINO|nr:unnamed protein product [Polarella glacialis]
MDGAEAAGESARPTGREHGQPQQQLAREDRGRDQPQQQQSRGRRAELAAAAAAIQAKIPTATHAEIQAKIPTATRAEIQAIIPAATHAEIHAERAAAGAAAETWGAAATAASATNLDLDALVHGAGDAARRERSRSPRGDLVAKVAYFFAACRGAGEREGDPRQRAAARLALEGPGCEQAETAGDGARAERGRAQGARHRAEGRSETGPEQKEVQIMKVFALIPARSILAGPSSVARRAPGGVSRDQLWTPFGPDARRLQNIEAGRRPVIGDPGGDLPAWRGTAGAIVACAAVGSGVISTAVLFVFIGTRRTAERRQGARRAAREERLEAEWAQSGLESARGLLHDRASEFSNSAPPSREHSAPPSREGSGRLPGVPRPAERPPREGRPQPRLPRPPSGNSPAGAHAAAASISPRSREGSHGESPYRGAARARSPQEAALRWQPHPQSASLRKPLRSSEIWAPRCSVPACARGLPGLAAPPLAKSDAGAPRAPPARQCRCAVGPGDAAAEIQWTVPRSTSDVSDWTFRAAVENCARYRCVLLTRP